MGISEWMLCLAIAVWVLGKALFSIPRLYRNSRDQKGAITYINLSFLVGFKVITSLIALAAVLWCASLLDINDAYLQGLCELVFLVLFICGLSAFFVFIITFLIAKLNRFQLGVEENEVLDDVINRDL